MYAEHHSTLGQPASSCSTTTQGLTSAPDWLKLRNSCGACASSKLKCSQEKPTCSRCAKRGTACMYVLAKRGGRKPKNRTIILDTRYGVDAPHVNAAADMNTEVLFPSSSANWFAPSSLPRTIPDMPWQNNSEPSDILHDHFGPPYKNPSSTSMDTGAALDSFFPTPTFSNEEPDINLFGTADLFPSTTSSSSTRGSETFTDAFAASEDAVSNPSSLSRSSSLLHDPTFQKETRNGREESQPPPNQTSCSCLVQAHGFMKLLAPLTFLDVCSTPAPQGLEKTAIILSIQSVIAQNKATIEAVSTMLQCSCSQNGQLLSVVSLLVFKVLNCYAAVARKALSLQDPLPLSHECQYQHQQQRKEKQQPDQLQQGLSTPTVVGEYCVGTADSARVVTQLIFSELHHVRRIIDQLSTKLKMRWPRYDAAGGGGREGVDESKTERIELEHSTLPRSAGICHQLDTDLRNELRALSSKMLDQLKRL